MPAGVKDPPRRDGVTGRVSRPRRREPVASVVPMEAQAPWPGSRWRPGPRPGTYVLLAPTRIALSLAALAVASVGLNAAGVALFDATPITATTAGAAASSAAAFNPVWLPIIGVAVSGTLGAVVLTVRSIRRSSLFATPYGLWFWSLHSPVLLPWDAIYDVTVTRMRTGRAERWVPVVTDVGGTSFPVSAARSLTSSSPADTDARCSRIGTSIGSMAAHMTGQEPAVGHIASGRSTLPGSEPSGHDAGTEAELLAVPRRGPQLRRELPDGALPIERAHGADHALWLAVTAPVVVGILVGLGAGLGGGVVRSGTDAALLATLSAGVTIVLWLLAAVVLMPTRLRLCVGADWLAWRFPGQRSWRLVPFDSITRLDLPAVPPSRFGQPEDSDRGRRRLRVWLRTEDGRAMVLHLVNVAHGQSTGLGAVAGLYEQLTDLATGALAHTATDRLRSALERDDDPPQPGMRWGSSAARGAGGIVPESPVSDAHDPESPVPDAHDPESPVLDTTSQRRKGGDPGPIPLAHSLARQPWGGDPGPAPA